MSAARPDGLHDEVRDWIAGEVDPAAAAELSALLDAGDDAELAQRFAAPLTFGTAGLRGPLRAGPNGMNRAVVRRAAAGVATWVLAHHEPGATVVVGYDARHGSADFAHDSAAVLAARGLRAVLLPAPLPTPVLAYAVGRLRAAAGVMVTASHNPPRDNGYKVYAADGGQIVPPDDAQIEAAIRDAGPAGAIPLDPAGIEPSDARLAASYVTAVAGLAQDGPRALRIVHTALHGVGSATVLAVLAAAGFVDVHPVPEQQQPDPDFPTVAFPNPEEPGALDLALTLARECDADIVLANDPDADRCAVAARDAAGTWRALTGDEVGVLLADALLSRGVAGTYATTIVSSSQLGVLAAARGAGYAQTLTGFKWIVRAAPDLVFGYEEALGYAVAPHIVRDKDGISAALLVAEVAAAARQAGRTLFDLLEDLAQRYGRHVTGQLSLRTDDAGQIAATMRAARERPPARLLGEAVTVTDLLPQTDGLRWAVPGGRVVIRPSGTEPKLKAYLEVVLDHRGTDGDGGGAAVGAQRLAQLRREVAAELGIDA